LNTSIKSPEDENISDSDFHTIEEISDNVIFIKFNKINYMK